VVGEGDGAFAAIGTDAVEICRGAAAPPTLDVVLETRRAFPDVSFIALVSEDRSELVRDLLSEGIDDCVVRPIDPPAIVSLLARTRGRPDSALATGRRR
jgi:hypothetical protein